MFFQIAVGFLFQLFRNMTQRNAQNVFRLFSSGEEVSKGVKTGRSLSLTNKPLYMLLGTNVFNQILPSFPCRNVERWRVK